MDDEEYVLREPDEDENVLAFKELRLLERGYSPSEARFLAERHVDMHLLERLIGEGCPPDLAGRIAR